jgi:cholesterol oxidase
MGIPLNVTEWMKGYIGLGATDCDAGFIQGFDEGHSSYYEHEVAIQIADIDKFVKEPAHMARMEGAITCEKFGGLRPISDGVFNMLVDDKNPALKFMFYRMQFTDLNGKLYTTLGHKTIQNAHSLDLLSRITTLSIRVFEGSVQGPDMLTPVLGAPNFGGKSPLAMGVLHIQALDALRSAGSFKSPGSGVVDTVKAVAKFGEFYLDKLWDLYGVGHSSQRD